MMDLQLALLQLQKKQSRGEGQLASGTKQKSIGPSCESMVYLQLGRLQLHNNPNNASRVDLQVARNKKYKPCELMVDLQLGRL